MDPFPVTRNTMTKQDDDRSHFEKTSHVPLLNMFGEIRTCLYFERKTTAIGFFYSLIFLGTEIDNRINRVSNTNSLNSKESIL